ncbi:class I SAM-dependent methyltransferase [Mesobacillus foraminis]|uniref:class I SAM-dependent methyltransferase n=1 Tax=Mesobacillus foraminis TaxID=279826 RepID=UPI001BEA9454|nr:class I SAM-dependent methyltransferase [Mesobacillus foraminis]MBT2758788.1 class I SAM-dependent methyltransferase [Mesobacillus foraminis]
MNNGWNRFIYKIWAPYYDRFFNSGPFLKARQTLFKDMKFKKGDRVLFIGVGTGADLEQIPYDELDITAIDYSEEMLNQAREKYAHTTIEFLHMDAQNLDMENDTYDYVVASLILTVVPDVQQAFSEMVRVAKRDGEILIFDKFVSKGKELSLFKKIFRPIIRLLGTDIGISFERLYLPYKDGLIMIENQDLVFKGMYRKIRLKKK